MTALIKSRLSPVVFRDLILTGVRVGGNEAQAWGIVDEALPADQVLSRAISRAAALANKDRQVYRTLKRGMYLEALTLLESAALEFN